MWVSTLCALAIAGGDLLLNEILYDPPGGDAGYEFVELFNPTSDSIPLGGLTLAFVNGGDPQRPRELWRGEEGQQLAAGSYLLLAEQQVPARDVELVLGLQNGPDALWLLRDGRRIDAVAWGDLDGLGEGQPAVDISGASLARVPDGIDLNDNSLDFQALDPPTPGAPNSFDVQFRWAAFEGKPVWLETPGTQRAALAFVAVGDAPEQAANCNIWLDDSLVADERLVAARADTVWLELQLQLSQGRHRLRAEIEDDADSRGERLLSTGLGELVLHEILPRPDVGESEWLELLCPRAELCAGRRFAFADRSSPPRGFTLPPESTQGLVLLAADCEGVGGRDARAVCVELDGPWPSLNDRGSDGDVADVVQLFDETGVLIDHVPYGGEESIERDRSIEAVFHGGIRRWFMSPVEPTPGRRNASQSDAPVGAGLSLDPNPFFGDSGLLRVLLGDISAASHAEAEIRDLRGRLVRSLGVAASGSTQRLWIWDGRDAGGRAPAPGAYVVVVRVQAAGQAARSQRALLALGDLR